MTHANVFFNFLLLLIVAACITSAYAASPDLQVTPQQLPYGKNNQIVVTSKDNFRDASLSVLPGAPIPVDELQISDPARALAATEEYIAVLTTKSLQTFTIINNKISKTGDYALDRPYRKIVANEKRMLAIGEKSLDVFDIDAGGNVQHIASYAQDSPIDDATITGNTVFVLNEKNKVSALRVGATGNALEPMAETRLPFAAEQLVAADSRLYLAADNLIAQAQIKERGGIELISSTPIAGPVTRLQIENNRAYVTTHAKITIFDISQAAFRWLGSHGNVGEVLTFDVKDEHALLYNQRSEILLLNGSNATQPSIFSAVKSGTPLVGLAFAGAYGIAATGHSLRLFDFSHSAPAFSNENLDVGQGANFGGQRKATIDGSLLYVADWFSGVHIYDIAQPDTPRLIANLPTPGSAKGVAVRNGWAYIADDDHGLQTVAVHNPATATIISTLPTAGLAYTPKIVGNLLYLANHRGGIQIIDIAQADHPRLISEINTGSKAWALEVKDNYAYVANAELGVIILDVSDPNHVTQVGQFAPGGNAEDIAIAGNIAYVSFFDQGLYVIDISQPAAPQMVMHVPTPGNARGIELQGNYLYLADWLAGVHIFDLAEPQAPRLIATYDTDGAAWGVRAKEGYIYVLDWWGGLSVIDAREPARPLLAGTYPRGLLKAAAIQENYLYCAYGSGGVQIFDIKNPFNPTWYGGLDLPGIITDIKLAHKIAVAATEDQGIHFLDTSQPAQLRRINSFSVPGKIKKIAVANNRVYVLTATAGLLVIDFSNLPQLRLVAAYPGMVNDLALWNETLYLATPTGLFQTSLVDHTFNLPLTRLSHENLSLIEATENYLIQYSLPQGIQLWDRSSKKVLSSYQPSAAIIDLKLEDHTLLALMPGLGVNTFDITEPTKIKASLEYPLLGSYTRMIPYKNKIFLTGTNMPIAIDLFPVAPLISQNESQAIFDIPPTWPLGSYHLKISRPEGITIYPNIFEIKLGHSKPKITIEEFQKLLKEKTGH